MPFECEVETDAGTLAALAELLRKRWLAEELAAQVEQEEFARHCRELKAMEGVGAVKRAVHAFAFHDWALKLGSYDCWRDGGFLRYFDRIAPETRVDCGGTKVQVGYGRGARAREGARAKVPSSKRQAPNKFQATSSNPRIVGVRRRGEAVPRNVRETKTYQL